MWIPRQAALVIGGLLAALVATTAGHGAQAVQEFPLTDVKGIVERNVKVEAVDYLGRRAVKLTTESEDAGFALLPDTEFQDGTIEADIAVKVTTPPGVRMPGFIGIAFRARPDASHYELFYLRPGNARVADQSMRNHAAQYCAAPGFGWYQLRRAWPAVYEAYTDIQPEAWTHIRIDVAGRTAALAVNGAAQPTLMVDGLKGEDLKGGVALWGYPSGESYFSNVRVTHATPRPVKNGADAAGTWTARLATDSGVFDGTLQLRREGTALAGTWSGALGENRPVTGTWRDGYVELSIPGQWTAESGNGRPGPATVSLAGWFDDASGKGRAKVEGRADGQWTATRKP